MSQLGVINGLLESSEPILKLLYCRYIASEELPVHYGGLRKENDTDFSTEDVVSEIFINQSSTECIQIPAPEACPLKKKKLFVFFQPNLLMC